MNKCFYSSGFLYHTDSQQILLQQNSQDPKLSWTLLGEPCSGSETCGKNFQHVIQKLLKLKVPTSDIHGVYDYYHTTMKKKHFISYAEVKEAEKFAPFGNLSFCWFSLKEVIKLPVSTQTKQDIIVGFRVIESSQRRAAGEQTIG